MTALDELENRVKDRRALPSPEMRRAIRKAAGLTHEDLAGPLQVSRQAVAHWEAGTRRPRPRHLAGYVDLLRRLQELAQ